jgi:hypothetical protein
MAAGSGVKTGATLSYSELSSAGIYVNRPNKTAVDPAGSVESQKL